MNFLLSLLMLSFWIFGGFERLDMLIAGIVLAALWIPELYITKKYKPINNQLNNCQK